MDALTLLTADHNRVRGLFARFEKAKESDDIALMSDLVLTITHELEIHTDAEETIFYPWARGLNEEIREVVDEGIEEHRVAKTLLAEISGSNPVSDEWIAKVAVLIESVEHHATEEEAEMFPAIRGATDVDARNEVAERIEARKHELGAPPLDERLGLTMAELKELAKEQEIPGRSKMSHDELAATVAPKLAS